MAIFRAALLAICFFPSAVVAQDNTLMQGIVAGTIDRGQHALKETPERIDQLVNSALEGRIYSTPDECLGALQVLVTGSAVMANLMPFSRVTTFEDNRGPVARVRLLLNGEKLHVQASCEGHELSAEKLDWGHGEETPRDVDSGTLDAVLGMLLLLQLQGAFDEIDAAADTSGDIKAVPDGSAALPSTADQDVPDISEKTPLVSEQTNTASRRADGSTNSDDQPSADTISPDTSSLPLTETEKQYLVEQIAPCFNRGAMTADALRSSFSVEAQMNQDGRPEPGSLRIISGADTNPHTALAFESVRRALLRCAGNGYKLPPAKYDRWRSLRMRYADGALSIE